MSIQEAQFITENPGGNGRRMRARCSGVHVRSPDAIPWLQLIQRIADTGDTVALHELHEHYTPLRVNGSPPLSILAYLNRLRESSWARARCGGNPVAVDKAFNLTVGKFLEKPKGNRKRRKRGPDCRCYYRGFLSVLSKWMDEHPSATLLEQELACSLLLQRFVLHQFRKSCEEARRAANAACSRYTWRLPSGRIVVYMPVAVGGRRRRHWLEEHVEDPDPQRPGERQRVQGIVDAYLGVPRNLSIEGDDISSISGDGDAGSSLSPFEVVITAEGLAKAVADEKAANIHQQRPAIQRLHPSNLHRLVMQIFHDLQDGCYSEKRLAQQFGLSHATLSRVAGSRWRLRPGEPPPDIWANVAQVLSANNDFVEAAKDAGVWPRVQQTAIQARRSCNGRRNHA